MVYNDNVHNNDYYFCDLVCEKGSNFEWFVIGFGRTILGATKMDVKIKADHRGILNHK